MVRPKTKRKPKIVQAYNAAKRTGNLPNCGKKSQIVAFVRKFTQ